jgi:AraC-like DNA-binding protein
LRLTAPGHLRVEETMLPPGQEWSDETGAWRFVRISAGAAYWLGASNPRSLTQGEVLIISPAAKALVRASQLNTVSLHGFTFVPDWLCGFFTLSERRFFESAAQPAEPVSFLPSTHPFSQGFARLVGRGDADQELVQRADALSLVAAYFGQGLGNHELPPGRSPSVRDRFEQIVCQMPDLELIQHSPEQLARLCGCSARHFSRLFRERFGGSPRARQTEMRLLKARELLANSEKKIAQIALDSGYRSSSLFNSLFRRRFGASPSAWREQAAKANQTLFQDTDRSEVT